jgi:hypothetical protein
MAYVNKETKKELTPGIKKVLEKYGVKGTIKVDRYSTLVVTLRKVPAGLFTPKELTAGVNVYWIHEHFTGIAKKFLTELLAAMKGEKWYDRSNAMIDYFDTAWYNDIKIGEYGKPVEVI